MADITLAPAAKLVQALRNRQIGARELLERYLERIERYNPALNAVVHVEPERALARADEADAATARGEVWGPLHGLPITIKELIETRDFPWTKSDPEFAGRLAEVDAPAVASLVDAGAVVFGVTNGPKGGGDVQTYNAVYGTTNNPWDETRTSGGSSGGSAVALSAGLTGLELGSDVGGSIRTPAHYCGIYGHKPTFGIVPRRSQSSASDAAVGDLVVEGPMGRSAEDLDLELSVIARPESDQDLAYHLQLPPPRHESLAEYRVAAWFDDPAMPVDLEVQERLRAAVDALRGAGVSVDEAARPDIGGLAESHRVYFSLLASRSGQTLTDQRFERLVAEEQEQLRELAKSDPGGMHNGAMYHRTWLELNERRHRIRARWAQFFERFDVMLMPVTAVTAIPHDPLDESKGRVLLAEDPRLIVVNGEKRPYWDLLCWVGPATVAYLPATSAPLGAAAGGLPVGIQIVGPYLEDRTPIDFARRLAAVIGGFEPAPGYD